MFGDRDTRNTAAELAAKYDLGTLEIVPVVSLMANYRAPRKAGEMVWFSEDRLGTVARVVRDWDPATDGSILENLETVVEFDPHPYCRDGKDGEGNPLHAWFSDRAEGRWVSDHLWANAGFVAICRTWPVVAQPDDKVEAWNVSPNGSFRGTPFCKERVAGVVKEVDCGGTIITVSHEGGLGVYRRYRIAA